MILMELPQIERWLSYSEVRQLTHTHAIRRNEIPIEHFVSLPLPTRRFGVPTYACYAAPSSRGVPPTDGTPLLITQQRPDRWWLFSARSEQLLHYTQCQLYDFTTLSLAPSITYTDNRSLAELRQLLVSFDQLIEPVLPAFFRQEPIEPVVRQALLNTMDQLILPTHRPAYEALAPDFFEFLTAH